MGVTFKRDQSITITDMCIYIDEHFHEVAEPGKHSDVEDKICEYLYHIVNSLALRGRFFQGFADYETFALYAASELFIAMRKKLYNAGKEVHGRVIMPVKSCLNFIKATIYPLRVNYQQENFGAVRDARIHEGVEQVIENMRNNVMSECKEDFSKSYAESVRQLPKMLKEILQETPFRNDKVMCQKLYLSVLLTLLNDLTIPNKLKEKLSKVNMNNFKSDKELAKMMATYSSNKDTPILWHIDDDIRDYVRILVCKLKGEMSKEVRLFIHSNSMSDEAIDNIMRTAYIGYEDVEELD